MLQKTVRKGQPIVGLDTRDPFCNLLFSVSKGEPLHKLCSVFNRLGQVLIASNEILCAL